MLPWFVWREIIHYTVSYDRKYCLVNKEWFNYTAGQFITLNNQMLIKDSQPDKSWTDYLYKFIPVNFRLHHKINQPSDLTKIARNIELDEFKNVNYEALNEYHQLRLAGFKFINEVEDNLQELGNFINNSKLESIYLYFEGTDLSNKLLQEVSRQLRSLEIYCLRSMMNYEKWLTLEYPNLINFKVGSYIGAINLDLIYQNMPCIENLSFFLSYDNIQPFPTKNYVFSSLKTLEIGICDSDSRQDNNIVRALFQCHFPALLIFKLQMAIYNVPFQRISQIMPQLQSLYLDVYVTEIVDLIFPVRSLSKLKELTFFNNTHLDEELWLQIDLSLLPQLQILKFGQNIELINSNPQHPSQINDLSLKNKFTFPNQIIYDQLISLYEIEIDCRYLNDIYDQVIQFCNRVTKLTLTKVRYPLPIETLSGGSFKTQQLKITGWRFLTDDFIAWLSKSFPLTHLTIEYEYQIDATLQPVLFPNLQVLVTKHGGKPDSMLPKLFLMSKSLTSNK